MSLKICPECDRENPASEDICIQCGFPLEDIHEILAPNMDECSQAV